MQRGVGRGWVHAEGSGGWAGFRTDSTFQGMNHPLQPTSALTSYLMTKLTRHPLIKHRRGTVCGRPSTIDNFIWQLEGYDGIRSSQ